MSCEVYSTNTGGSWLFSDSVSTWYIWHWSLEFLVPINLSKISDNEPTLV